MGDDMLRKGGDIMVDQAISKSGYSKADQEKLQRIAASGKAAGEFGAMVMVAASFGTLAKAVPAVRTQTDRPTYLYDMVGANGEHLKYGVTLNPETRYSTVELNGGSLKILADGPRPEMLYLERQLHETMPIGPREAQSIYLQIQLMKGYVPPSQYPAWNPTK